MEVVKKGSNIVKCPICGSILKFDQKDIYTKHEYDIRQDVYDASFVNCPVYETEIRVSGAI